MAQATEQTDALVGRTLGEFVILELIGEGGFGRVYRAEQPALQREAVVKVLRLEEGRTSATDRFLREARLASRLDHPFAAHIYAFGAEPDHLLWIAMELVRGTPLDRVLAEGPLPVERAIPFVRRVCEVVHTAHEQGIVHRDLKPANIMVLARAGNIFPKLLDLGIAKDVGADETASVGGPASAAPRPLYTTGPGHMGTPYYMAPEQWLNPAGAGPPSDIYALGVLTYEVLTGSPPFRGESIIEVAKQHARARPSPLPERFPPQLSEAIAKAMAKKPGDRFATALGFSEALIESSGIALDSVNLPKLDELTRDDVLLRAPQPIAEVSGALESARNPNQALEALWQIAATCAQYVGVVALACRSRVGPGRYSDSEAAARALGALTVGQPDALGWWRLARELVRPFHSIPDAHPIPELVALFFDGGAELRTAMDELLKAQPPGAGANEVRTFLVGAVPALAAVLGSLGFLSDYCLGCPRDGRLEKWMGVRQPTRATIEAAATAEQGRPVLVDRAGQAVVSLWPVAQCAPPSPNQPQELFLFSGVVRNRAVLIAPPVGYERRDDGLLSAIALAVVGDRESHEDAAASPYRGLATFTQADAGSFFGREREVEAFVNRLRTTALIAVVGPSGAGKSSFIRAGVLPSLAGSWTASISRPGANPTRALAAALVDAGVDISAERIVSDPKALGEALRAAIDNGGQGLVVVVDQFEELFTLCHDAAERDAFATALVTAPAVVGDKLRVLLTLRDDFLVRAVQVPALREPLTGSLQVLATPVPEDLRRILVEPARRAGYEFEDDALPLEMVEEVASEPGALALLSFTAYQLWQFRDRHFRKLKRVAYRALGGVGGALAQHAEAILDELRAANDDADNRVREIFRHLITADGTRAVMSRSELLQVAGGEQGQPVLEALIGARLLTAMEGAGEEEHIEVVHEALLSAWPRVVGWRQDDAQSARLRDQLRVAARQWVERERPRGLLWRGDALAELRLWRARYRGALTDNEESFTAASTRDAARGRRLRQGALLTIFAALTIALIVFVRLRGVAETSRERAQASATALADQLTASFEEQGRRALLEGDSTSALLYLERALSRGADSQALRFMIARGLGPLEAELATLDGRGSPVIATGFSPTGASLYTASGDGTVTLWDALTYRERATLSGHEPGWVVARYSPDGALIATGGVEGVIRLWHASSGEFAAVLSGHTGKIAEIAFAPDSRTIYSAAADGSVRVWDVAKRETVGSFAVATAGDDIALDLSPDGERIAIGTFSFADFGGTVAVWSRQGRKLASLEGHEGGIWFVRFDPSGDRVATASTDGSSRVFDSRTGATIVVLRGHDHRVTDVQWSPSGVLLATASADTLVKLWNPTTGASVAGLRGHTGQVNRVRFSRDGARLLSVAADGTGRLWEPRRGVLLSVFSHGGFVGDADFHPDGDRVATVSQLGTGKIWRVSGAGVLASFSAAAPPGIPSEPIALTSGEMVHGGKDAISVWDPATNDVRRLEIGGSLAAFAASSDSAVIAGAMGPDVSVWRKGAAEAAILSIASRSGSPISALALSGDGARLAAIAEDGTLRLWLVENGSSAAEAALGEVATGLPWQLGFSASGSVLVAVRTGDSSQPSRFLDAHNLAALGDLGQSYGVVFSQGGRAASLSEGGVAIHDERGMRATLLEPPSTATAAAWSPDGSQLFVGQSSGGLRVYETTAWTTVGDLDAHDLFIPDVALSEDGALVATVGFDATVKIWDRTSLRQLDELRVEGQTNSVAFLSGGRLATSNGPNIDVWSVSQYAGTKDALASRLRCRVPYVLEQLSVVSKNNFVPCEREE